MPRHRTHAHPRFALREARQLVLSLIVLSLALSFIACASIPAQAPELSNELGHRLQALENSHLALLHKYMDERRARVNEFVNHEWTPTFTREFFFDPQMQAAWAEVVQSGSEEDRSGYLLNVAPILMEEISAKRNAMLLPLYEIERELEQRLRADYIQAKAINNSLTAFLASASEVERTRQEYLARAGVEEDALRGFVADMDETVNDLIGKKNQAVDAYQTAQDYLTKMKEILDRLRNQDAG